jgi:hypothetical protein
MLTKNSSSQLLKVKAPLHALQGRFSFSLTSFPGTIGMYDIPLEIFLSSSPFMVQSVAGHA